MALHLAARRAEHHPRRERADGCPPGTRLHLRRPQCPRRFLPRQGDDRPLLVPRDLLPQRAPHDLPLLPLYAGAAPCEDRGCRADAADRPRRGCRGAAPRHRERSDQANLADRRAVAVELGSRPAHPQRSRAGRHRRYRGRHRRLCQAQQADRAPHHDAVGIRAGGAPGIDPDAGAQVGRDRQPHALAGERRYAAPHRRRGRGPAAAAERDNRL
ncbi:hypothetical protein ACVMGE_001281 [Bradyrhizobium diazoefficiens]